MGKKEEAILPKLKKEVGIEIVKMRNREWTRDGKGRQDEINWEIGCGEMREKKVAKGKEYKVEEERQEIEGRERRKEREGERRGEWARETKSEREGERDKVR